MQVTFFGKLGDLIARSIELEDSPETVEELRRMLAERYPHAAADLLRPSVRACIGDDMVGDDQSLAGIESIEFLPPLSGG